MSYRIAINGLGRIGRSVLRAYFERDDLGGIELVALNEIADIQTLAHLTRYDSTHGKFSGTVAVDGVDISVAPGEVCAIVGQNGAGKSTLMGILAGALRPDAGSMTLGGAPYHPQHPLEARRAGVATGEETHRDHARRA